VEDARVVGGVVEVAAGVTVEAAHLLARLGMRRIEGRIVEPEARSRELRLAVERGLLPPGIAQEGGHVARAMGASTTAQRATGRMTRVTRMGHLERKYVSMWAGYSTLAE